MEAYSLMHSASECGGWIPCTLRPPTGIAMRAKPIPAPIVVLPSIAYLAGGALSSDFEACGSVSCRGDLCGDHTTGFFQSSVLSCAWQYVSGSQQATPPVPFPPLPAYDTLDLIRSVCLQRLSLSYVIVVWHVVNCVEPIFLVARPTCCFCR